MPDRPFRRRRPLRPLPRPDPAERRAVDGWVRIVPGVVAAHVLLLAILWARPGRIAIWLWYAGPVALALTTLILLVLSLRSAYRWKHGANVWQLLAYASLFAVIFTLPVYDPYPSSHDDEPSPVEFRLPLDEPLTVAWGGATSDVNYHVYLPDQRWAYDLVVTREGRTFATDGVALDDYHAYGLPVYAPASGVVFASHDGEPEVQVGATRWGMAGLGNHVGIEVAPNQYLFVGHLQPGSVAVSAGERVTAGQLLGIVGNSGNSSEPHIHLHLQDSTRPYFGEGIPFHFHGYRYEDRAVARGMPEGGWRDGQYLGARIVHAPMASAASDDLTLAAKARLFDVDLAERFLAADGQVRVRRRLPTADHPHVTYNMSDTAYMTGLYCAAQTWRHLATGEPEAAARARAASAALRHLVAVTGRPGLLARASAPIDEPWFDDGTWRVSADGGRRWRGNVSSDQVDAMMFGLYVYGTHIADPAERRMLGATAAEVVDAIVGDGLRIIGYDGEPTRWGRYEPTYVAGEEPMNALLMLQMVKVAEALTGLPRFGREYERLLNMGYARIGEGARRDRPPREANHSDDVLIALALYPLLELEQDSAVRGHYERAAERWFHGGAHPGIDVEANPLATFLYRHWTGDESYDAAALDTLRGVPLDMKWNPDTIAAYSRRFGFSFTPDPVLPQEGDGPLPIAQRGRTWSFLVHNPYHRGGDRLVAAPFETNGLDYLLSYWFGRAHGVIQPTD